VTNLSPNEFGEKGEDCYVEALESEIAREDEEVSSHQDSERK
jgi:hypothetical protein